VKLIESMSEIISVSSRFGPFDIANNAVQVQSAQPAATLKLIGCRAGISQGGPMNRLERAS
jgi:hypothetical protein